MSGDCSAVVRKIPSIQHNLMVSLLDEQSNMSIHIHCRISCASLDHVEPEPSVSMPHQEEASKK